MNIDLLLNETGDEIEDNVMEEEITHLDDCSVMSEPSRQSKRVREEEEEEAWTQVKKRKERINGIRDITEISITSNEKFPKQFALAKLFKSQNIANITRVKYINPYKIIVELKGDKNADLLVHCDHLLGLGWRFQRPFEVGLSFGVIKNIELDLSEQDLLEAITSSSEVVNVRRLKRRTEEDVGWTDSESVRVGFRGASLPSFLCIHDMQVKVEPYLFPVTQCSRCWRYGHTVRMCPSKRIYCPKCGGKHENCDISTYKCINCTNNHTALNRRCPEYLKERKIRELMAEFNVSYRKAITMYVPPQTPAYEETHSPVRTDPSLIPIPATPNTPQFITSALPVQEVVTYAQAASSSYAAQKDTTTKPEETSKETKTKKKKKKRKNQKPNLDDNSLHEMEVSSDSEDNACDKSSDEQNKSHKERGDLPFFSLLKKLRNILGQSSDSWMSRIQKVVQQYVEWTITWIFQNIPNLPFLQNLFD